MLKQNRIIVSRENERERERERERESYGSNTVTLYLL